LSRGGAQTTALGNVAVGGADLTQADTLEGGEIKFYTFAVPAGLASVQVSLENRTGNPWLGLPSVPDRLGRNNFYNPARSYPHHADNYGLDRTGSGAVVQDGASFVTLANPAAGTYTVAVRASAADVGNYSNTHPDASQARRGQADRCSY